MLPMGLTISGAPAAWTSCGTAFQHLHAGHEGDLVEAIAADEGGVQALAAHDHAAAAGEAFGLALGGGLGVEAFAEAGPHGAEREVARALADAQLDERALGGAFDAHLRVVEQVA